VTQASPPPQAGSTSLAAPSMGPLQAWTRFWFAPASPFGLHVVRLLTGLLLLAWLLPLASDVQAFFGLQGWFDRRAYVEAARLTDGSPKTIGWSLLYLCGSSASLLKATYWSSIAIVALFTLGVATRWTGVLTWLVVVSFTANPAFDDEVDPLLQLLTLYLAIGYLQLGLRNRGASWFERIVGRTDTFLLGRTLRRSAEPARKSVAANLALRLIQIHLTIVLVTTGLHKLQFGEWWSGIAFWFPLQPALKLKTEQLREMVPYANQYLIIITLAAYATLAWQLLFPVFAWRKGLWRIVLLGGAVAGWIGSAYIYQAPLFGAAIAVGCVSFLSEADWAFVGRLFQRVPAVGRIGEWSASQQERRPHINAAGKQTQNSLLSALEQ
jgi:hypothetical protein